MRDTRLAQTSLFELYSEHEFGERLKTLSRVLDEYPLILQLLEKDLIGNDVEAVGRKGLTVESVFRCLLLKKMLQVSYQQLAFHLSDSMSYRSFARLTYTPKKSSLQSTIRRIQPATLALVHEHLSAAWVKQGRMSLDKVRIDSTVVNSHISPPSDSQLLTDGVRVLSRLLAKSRDVMGIKLRFTDQRKVSKSLAFRIFNGKNTVKQALYPELLRCVGVVLKQVERGLRDVCQVGVLSAPQHRWVAQVEHYRDLTLRVVDQTVRRVIDQQPVASAEKIVSLFEAHTDIIIKGFRDVQYGHKINLSTEQHGFISCLSIEKGNPSDSERFLPMLQAHEKILGKLPKSVVCDGGYASKDNVTKGRALGVQQVVFHKRAGISYRAMGVKQKTFERLRHFRAGIEGNISELKRSFGAGKATWKAHDGFKAFVWSSVITYNLVRMARLQSG